MRVGNLTGAVGREHRSDVRAASSDFRARLDPPAPTPPPAPERTAGAEVVRTATELLRAGGPAPAEAGSSSGAMVAHQQAMHLQLLTLQHELTKGTTSCLSNVLRVRHDTTKNAIGNIR